MTKGYEFFRKRVPLPGGGFREAFLLGLVEFSCLGERHFDVEGYPYDSEAEALLKDWERLGSDFSSAAAKLEGKVADTGGQVVEKATSSAGRSRGSK